MSWNVANGAGHVQQLIGQLADAERRANRPEPDFILLLQEALSSRKPRSGTEALGERVPRSFDRTTQRRDDVTSLAEQFDLNAAYVPSMPHRAAARDRAGEDRGNAILSTLPLQEVIAIELPLVRQRRVAVAARIDVDGARMMVVTAHLSPRRTLLQGWMFSGPWSRERQAATMLNALALLRLTGPVIVAGDFNTVAGEREPAIRRMRESFTRIECGSRITHRWGFSLDYVFASDPSILESCDRVGKRYGSDHHPLVARVVRASLGRPEGLRDPTRPVGGDERGQSSAGTRTRTNLVRDAARAHGGQYLRAFPRLHRIGRHVTRIENARRSPAGRDPDGDVRGAHRAVARRDACRGLR